MVNRVPNLSAGEVTLLFAITEKLSRNQDREGLRKEIAGDVLRLLKSDFIASYIWNDERKTFESAVFLNMNPDNLACYERYYQFCDPITPALQKRRRATLVCEIMPQEELEKTEFFNDFLMADGLHHGINVYAYDGDLNIGDLRIWRARHRPEFGTREALLLDTVLPHFRNALRNARALAAVRGQANMWHDLMDKTPAALFLFDDAGRLVYRNRNAAAVENEISNEAYASFYGFVRSLRDRDLSRAQWGPFFLSVLRLTSPHNTRPHTAVLAQRSNPEKVDEAYLRRKYRLSPREAEIALLVCKGLTDPEIASVLGIAFSTVRTHLKHLFMKLDVTTRSEMIHALLEDIVEFSF
jgi:DNA-binding CsgD family transcriptional regulator/PAS domain-containing protein